MIWTLHAMNGAIGARSAADWPTHNYELEGTDKHGSKIRSAFIRGPFYLLTSPSTAQCAQMAPRDRVAMPAAPS